jgi:hypothetical protein
VQILSDGSKYKIYKSIKTKFVPANYSTNGLSSTGNEYDEYSDSYTYYLLSIKSKNIQKFTLKKKVLKEIFFDDETKLDSFLNGNNSTVDDDYLKKLGNYMNN